MHRKINKVLIIERSEMGLRALDVCLKLNIDFVVGFSASDNNSFLVRSAKKYVKTRPNSGIAYLGEDLHDGYYNIDRIIETAKLWNCDSIYPGYNVLSENYFAVKKIEESGLRWIGPNSNIIKIFGDRKESMRFAKMYKINVLRSYNINSRNQIIELLKKTKISLPFIIKARESGGGKGNFLVRALDDLTEILAKINIKNNNFYVEKYISGRHMEIQFISGDRKVEFLSTRDCSCQIRFQKILEEGPAKVEERQLIYIKDCLSLMLLGMKYVGVGTAEFICDVANNKVYFLEVNPRIQVESPVTEKMFNIDLVEIQFILAQGDMSPLKKKYNKNENHVIEARVYARNIDTNFSLSSGRINIFEKPKIEGIFCFSGYEKNDYISEFYDPLIIKVVSVAKSRDIAIKKLAIFLKEMKIEGVFTNINLLLWLLSQKTFLKGEIYQDFIEGEWSKLLAEKKDEIKRFLNTGIFNEVLFKNKVNVNKITNDLEYVRKNRNRNYKRELKSMHQKNTGKSAFRFGCFKREGVEVIFCWWDFLYFGGTLGVDETMAIEECFALAHEKKYPIIMISNSGGARQQENSLSLSAMQYILTSYKQYDIPLLINVYYKENYGGVNVSLAELADIKIATIGSKIGLTSPQFLSIPDKEIVDRIHDPIEHYKSRNVDMVCSSLEEACNSALEICNFVFGHNSEILRQRVVIKKRNNRKLCSNDCLKYINSKKRLRFFDIISGKTTIFDDLILINNNLDEVSTLPISAALVRIGGFKAVLVGQQNPLNYTDNSCEVLCPGAKDYKWFSRIIDLAEKLKLPLVLFGDTDGADAGFNSEQDGVSYEILHSLLRQVELTVPIISINLGICGSGGGLPFVNPANWSAAMDYSLKLVSNMTVQSAILCGSNDLNEKQRSNILSKLNDSIASGQKYLGLIDHIIVSDLDVNVVAQETRIFLLKTLTQLSEKNEEKLIIERHIRQKKFMELLKN